MEDQSMYFQHEYTMRDDIGVVIVALRESDALGPRDLP